MIHQMDSKLTKMQQDALGGLDSKLDSAFQLLRWQQEVLTDILIGRMNIPSLPFLLPNNDRGFLADFQALFTVSMQSNRSAVKIISYVLYLIMSCL